MVQDQHHQNPENLSLFDGTSWQVSTGGVFLLMSLYRQKGIGKEGEEGEEEEDAAEELDDRGCRAG